MAVLITTSGGLSGQFQKFFRKQLLTPVEQLLVMDQFAQFAQLPEGAGALTVRFTRPDSPDRAQVDALTEGDPSTLTDTSYTYSFIDATPTQIGKKARVSDILSATNLFDTTKNVLKRMGGDAAHYLDFSITTEIQSGIASGSKRYSGGATDFASLVALPASDSTLSIVDLLKAQTQLTIARAPTAEPNSRAPKAKGGDYVAILPPQVAFNIYQDAKFIDAGVRGQNDGLFNGEMGTWYGVRVIKGTQPWREATGGAEGTYSSTGGVYATIVTGSEAYGIVNLTSQSAMSPKIMVVDKPDSNNPALQYITLAWKAYFCVKTLKNDWSVVIRSQSTYS